MLKCGFEPQLLQEAKKEAVSSLLGQCMHDYYSMYIVLLMRRQARGKNPTLCARREDRDTCDRSGPTSHR